MVVEGKPVRPRAELGSLTQPPCEPLLEPLHGRGAYFLLDTSPDPSSPGSPELMLPPSRGSRGDASQVLQNVLSSSWYLEASVGDRQFVYVMRFMGESPYLCLWTHTAVCGPGFPVS